MTEKQELRVARIAAAIAVLVAGYMGIHPPGFVAEVVAFAFGLAAASFFPAILMGIFSRRMNREGAVAGMIVGVLFTATYIVWFTFLNKDYKPGGPMAGKWPFFGISPQGIGFVGMLLNFVVAVTVSRFTPPPPDEIREIIDNIRLPDPPER